MRGSMIPKGKIFLWSRSPCGGSWRCGGSLVAYQTSRAEVPGWFTIRHLPQWSWCATGSLRKKVENLRVERETYPWGKKDLIFYFQFFFQIPWDRNDEALAKWANANTGFPWIDAIMTQLRCGIAGVATTPIIDTPYKATNPIIDTPYKATTPVIDTPFKSTNPIRLQTINVKNTMYSIRWKTQKNPLMRQTQKIL